MARSVRSIYEEVGNIIIESMIFTLKNYKPYGLNDSSELIKSFDYDINFSAREEKTGQFKKMTLNISMNQYGLALDKGRQGTEGNRNIRTKWKNGTITGVPISALIKFIKKRGLQTKIKDKKGRFQSVNKIAFILQKSIKKNGITPRNFLLPAIEEGQKRMDLFFDRELIDLINLP